MTDKTDGQIAYEAAAKLTKCDQPWNGANQRKWEYAAKAVNKRFVEQACDAVDEVFNNGNYVSVNRFDIKQAIRDKFK